MTDKANTPDDFAHSVIRRRQKINSEARLREAEAETTALHRRIEEIQRREVERVNDLRRNIEQLQQQADQRTSAPAPPGTFGFQIHMTPAQLQAFRAATSHLGESVAAAAQELVLQPFRLTADLLAELSAHPDHDVSTLAKNVVCNTLVLADKLGDIGEVIRERKCRTIGGE